MKSLSVLIFLLLLPMFAISQSPVRVLVVTGGHDFNRTEFEGMLDSLPEKITYKIAELPAAFELFEKQHRNDYDVLVFYHMWQDISAKQQNELEECISGGKPLVVLHHSICAFDNWDEYTRIIGGRYLHRADTIDGRNLGVSSYQHDVPVSLRIKDANHPVTKGVNDFTILDETYDHFYVRPDVTPLLVTDTPGSTDTIGWTTTYGRSRIVTLQSGHDVPAFRSPHFRRLVSQAISWVLFETLSGFPTHTTEHRIPNTEHRSPAAHRLLTGCSPLP